MKIAIVGFGSIGRRHAKNLKKLGHQIIPIDIGEELVFDVHCAFICTPTMFHAEHSIAYIKKNIPVFIEKPLTYCFGQLELIEQAVIENPVISMVGCNLRFHPSIIKAKTVVESEKVLFARAETGYYLPFWRKTDYKHSYSASDYGGVILDAIHEPDYLYWLFGKIKELKIVSDKISDLEIEKEDIAEIIMSFERKILASVNCNYLLKNYHRKLDLYLPDRIISYQIKPVNIMYYNEVKYFIDCVQNKIETMNSIKEAGYVLRKILQGNCNNSGALNIYTPATENTQKTSGEAVIAALP